MALRTADVLPYLDPARWDALARVKRDAWLARWRRGPAAQIRAMAELRVHTHAIRGACPQPERDADLDHHIRLSKLMRRADSARG